MKNFKNLEKLSDIELIKQYSKIVSLMKKRGLVKSRNMVGELGKHYAVEAYNESADLPNLQAIPAGVRNINAMSKDGKRYAVKSTTKALTGSFYGLNPPDSEEPEEMKFEYAVIVLLDEDFGLKQIAELTWEQFLEFKKWNKATNAWNISITKKLLSAAKMVFSSEPEAAEKADG